MYAIVAVKVGVKVFLEKKIRLENFLAAYHMYA